MDKKNNNDMLFLGIFLLITGISLLSYSIVSFKEVKKLESQIDFEELNNPKMSNSKKFDKQVIIEDFLNTNLEKYKNLPVKNTVCIYLDYSQHNMISMYNTVYNSPKSEKIQKSTALKYLQYISSIYNNYKTCPKYAAYSKEIQNLLEKAQKSDEAEFLKEAKVENFLYGGQNITRYSEQKSDDALKIPTDDETIEEVEKMEQSNSNYEEIH